MNTNKRFYGANKWATALSLIVFAATVISARATVVITPATGGTAISADTAASISSAAWTTLGPITVAEAANAAGRNDFTPGNNVTLILTAPAGFEFNTAVTPSISRSGSEITAASVTVPDRTHVTVTITVTNTLANDSFTIGATTGLQVRPTLWAPLASGQIFRNATNGGTALLEGLATSTNANGSGGFNFATLTEAPGTNKLPVLILYDGAGSFGWIGNLHAKLLANLMGHFSLPYIIKPVESYASNDVDRAYATFYLGMSFGNTLPQSFINDVSVTTNTVCWFKNNLWEVSGTVFSPKPIDSRIGFRVVTLDGLNPDFTPNTNLDTSIVYKGESFDKNKIDPTLGLVETVDSNIFTVPMVAWRTNTSSNTVYSVPYVAHGSNFWYIGDSPFDYMTETSRYIAFVDLLHDIVGIDHAESHQAVIRIEDVTMNVYLPGEITRTVDTLRTNNVPFALATIPYYRDPNGYYNGGVPEEHVLSDLSDSISVGTVSELKYALTNGGQIITHGFTHQYNSVANPSTGTTADDFEFWRETFDTNSNLALYQPVPEDSLAWASDRYLSASNEIAASGLTTVGWEPPHYAGSVLDYQYFATNESLTMARALYFSDDYSVTNFYSYPNTPPHIAGQFFPVSIQRDVYGQKIVPENLGNYEPNPLPGAAPRTPQQIVAAAKKNLVIRDGWANAFFHGFYDPTNLSQIVNGVKALGYTYIPLSPSGKPVITFQPKTQTNLATGIKTKLGVAVIGSAPLVYQWRLNGTNIAGATNALLNFASLQVSDAGDYTAVITNNSGSVTSIIATLTINVGVLITNQPQNVTTIIGGSASFAVGVTGTGPFAYQWWLNGSNQLAGATAATLTLTNVQATDVGGYTVVVTNISGVVTSSVASLSLAAPPVITNSPASQSVVLGGTANFAAGVSGSPTLVYQWFFNQTNRLSGATNNPLVLTNVSLASAGGYSVIVTNNYGSATSSVAQLTVALAPAITNQPHSLTNLAGTSATFTVLASGDAPLVYQWRFNGTNISGATSNSLSFASVQVSNAGNYDVVITNNSGSITSIVATLTVNVPAFISVQPLSVTNLAGTSASFSVTAGGTAPFAYQWRFGGTNVAGATNTSLSLVNIQSTNAGNYDVVVSNNFGSVTSSVASLTVNVPVFITAQPLSVTNLQGSNVTFSVSVAGTAPFAYRWRFNGTNLAVGIATNSSLSVTNIQSTNAGNYDVVITNNYGSVTSSIATLTVNVPVFISTQPASRTNLLGTTASFTVTAGGTAPFAYQWRFGGTNIDSGTNSSLSVSNVQTTNVGGYDVVITNNFGSVTSSVASLTVNVPAFITAQPLSLTNLQGSNVSFSVSVDGTAPFAYRWRFGGTNLPVAIATNSSLSVTNIQSTNAGNYDVVITNNYGSVTSSIAALTVNVPVFISTQPASRTNLLGTTASFTVTGGGTAPFAFQWRFGGTNIDGGTSSSLSVSNVQTTNAGNYDVVITNNFGSVTSSIASLTVNVPVFITAQPLSITNMQGSNVSFSVSVDGTAPFAYRWRFKGTNLALSIATNSTLSVTNIQATNAGNYDVIVTNNYGSVTSSVAVLTVNVPVFISTQPASRTNLAGTTASFTVTAGGTAPFAYQWRFGGTNMDGATNSSLSLPNVQTNNVGGYDVVITNNFGSVTSSVATLTVTVPVFITSQPVSVTNLQGTTASFSVAVDGTSPFAYRWRFKGTNLPVAIATNSSLSVLNVQATNAGNYDVVITNNYGSVTSSVATLTVNVPVFVSTQPAGRTNLVGTTASFSVVAGGSAPFAYQWRFGGTNIDGSTNTSLSLPNVQTNAAGAYDVVITNDFGSVTSSVATLTVTVPVFITGQPLSVTNLQGSNVSFSVSVDGTAPFAYRWRFNGTNIAGSAGAAGTLSLTNIQATNAGNYDVVVTNNFGSVTSSVATLTVNVPVFISTQPANRTNLLGTAASFSVVAGGTAPFGYQWRFGGTNVAGATNNLFSIAAVQTSDVGSYDVVVTNNFGSVTSAPASLTVNVPVFITGQPLSVTNLQGSNVSFSVSVDGTAPFAYRWRFNGSNIAGALATSATLNITNIQATNAGNYDVVVTNNYGSVTSSIAALTVQVPAFISVQPQNQSNLAGTTANFSVTAGGTPVLTYQWRFGGTNLSGATNSALSLPGVSAAVAGGYDVVVTNDFGSVTSIVATLTISTPPSITNQPSSRAVSAGNNATFTVGAQGDAVLHYQWRLNTTNIFGATSNVLFLTNVQLTNAGAYTVVVTNNFGSVTSSIANLTVSAPPSIVTQPQSRTNAPGTTATFTVSATGSGTLSYQWRLNTVDIPGATATTLTLTNVTSAQGGAYSVQVANLLGTAISQDAVLTVTVVHPVLEIEPAEGQDNTFVLSFNSVFGATYHIEYKDGLVGNSWQELGSVSGTGNPMSIQVQGGPDGQRYYRLRVE